MSRWVARWSAMALVLTGLGGMTGAADAAGFNDLVGTWDMSHDGWAGTLAIDPSDQRQVVTDGPCTYTYDVFSGTWTAAAGSPVLPVSGTFGGHDPNAQGGGQCKASAHLVNMKIDFGPSDPPQQFSGYIFTQDSRHMAGLTWWHLIPFGWSATKR